MIERAPHRRPGSTRRGLTRGRLQRNVMIVEDDAPIGELLLAIVAETGPARAELSEANEDAVERIRETRPALVLLDVEADSFQGLDIARRLKSDPAAHDVPIIGLTDRPWLKERVLAAGCDHCIHKPFNLADLVDHVRHYLAS